MIFGAYQRHPSERFHSRVRNFAIQKPYCIKFGEVIIIVVVVAIYWYTAVWSFCDEVCALVKGDFAVSSM